MQKFETLKGLVAPIDRENVDTDAIIPKQFLKSIRKTGFGQNLFDEWRYLDAGYPGQDPASRKPNPDFVLNQPRYQGASILLARKNFGCGSSREHAPWALDQFGFRGYSLTIDLERQQIIKPDGQELPFEVQAFRKYCLLNGYDDIGLTLRHADKIRAFEAQRLTQKPWLARTLIA
ncbi:MAG: 3-isopropylmalate dehydratase small subunit [Betaproteobacteria bacterium]|nr:3-isopropylmalate dehydratase small subunit [Betaproteobacteria bacterium]